MRDHKRAGGRAGGSLSYFVDIATPCPVRSPAYILLSPAKAQKHLAPSYVLIFARILLILLLYLVPICCAFDVLATCHVLLYSCTGTRWYHTLSAFV